jgi:cell division protein FtsB
MVRGKEDGNLHVMEWRSYRRREAAMSDVRRWWVRLDYNDFDMVDNATDPMLYGDPLYVLATDHDAAISALTARVNQSEAKNNDLVDELAAARFENDRLTARVAELEAEVKQLGEMSDTCTYHALHRVCDGCRCQRKPPTTGEKS